VHGLLQTGGREDGLDLGEERGLVKWGWQVRRRETVSYALKPAKIDRSIALTAYSISTI
jgi:hypothetical protein